MEFNLCISKHPTLERGKHTIKATKAHTSCRTYCPICSGVTGLVAASLK